MPEGDTVWQTAKRLSLLSGQLVVASDFRVPSLATSDVSGASILETVSRGKHLLTRFSSGLSLHTHLVMEGAWIIRPVGTRWQRPAHQARVVLRTTTHEAVGFDVRVDLVRTAEEGQFVDHLGPDLLGPDWDAAVAVSRLSASPAVPVGEALLEQRNLAGVGNVYKCELCFLTGVDPRTPVGSVPNLPRMVDTAHRLLVANRDRVDRITTGDRRRGQHLWVYGRRGPCLRCGTAVQKAELGSPGQERPTYWCPHCQPLR